MRILILTTFFPPLNSIASHRPYSWAKYWNAAGHSVTVATTPKGKVEGEFELIEVQPPRLIDRMKGKYQDTMQAPPFWKRALLAPYHYLRHERGILNASRMPDFTDLWIRPLINRLTEEQPWDWIVSTAGPYAVHIAAERLKKMGKGAFWAADFRDLWCDNHAYPGIFPFTYVEQWLETKLLKKADLITTVSYPWAEILGKKHGAHKVQVVENGFEPDDLSKISAAPFFPLDGKLRIVHTGMLYPNKQALSLFFEALHAFPHKENIECYFAGPHLQALESFVEKYQLRGVVKLMGEVSRSSSLAMQRDAQGLLFFPWNEKNGSGKGLLSGKIYEYLYAQKPIFALSEGNQPVQAAEQLIKESKAGVILSSPEEVCQALNALLQNYKTLQPASRSFLDQYSRKNLALKMLGYMDGKSLHPLAKRN